MKEKIIEMLKMQEALDNSFMEYMGRTEPLTVEEVQKALFDELGEVNHEMKAEWCYWKKSEKAVDREKVKEELSDVWHFVLSLHRLKNKFEFHEEWVSKCRKDNDEYDWFEVLKELSIQKYLPIYFVIILTEKLGFTFDEMYEAYIDKNKVNYQRMKEGY